MKFLINLLYSITNVRKDHIRINKGLYNLLTNAYYSNIKHYLDPYANLCIPNLQTT